MALADFLRRHLTLDPSRQRLSALLAGINVIVVVLVIAGILGSAIGRLHNLADQQGLSQVEIAGANAREIVRVMTEDAQGVAQGLAGRPTLRRLLAEGRQVSLEPFLRRACESGGADACIVVDGEAPVVAGRPVPLDAVIAASEEQGERFLLADSAADPPWLGARVNLPGSPARVYVLRALDGRMSRELSSRVGAEVELVNYLAFAAAAPGPYTALDTAALADGRSAARRLKNPDVYAAAFPVAGPTGEVVALIQASLPVAEQDAALQPLIRNLVLFALVLGTVAVIAGGMLGRWVAAPIRDLTNAAGRLGQGDFSTFIPTRGAAEVGVLARTMEDMRRSLVQLTTALRQREAEAKAVLGGIVEGVFAVDPERRIRYLNPRAEQLLGLPAADAVGRFCGDVLRPTPVDGRRPCETDCPILRARVDGSARATEQLQLPGGAPRTCVLTSAGMVDNLQVQVLRDETELEGVRRARDSVLANISHEFRTPLAAQLASIELLRDGLDTLAPAARRDLVLSLERGTVRLTQLIDNLLESVRIESGQLGLRRQPVALADVVDVARDLVEALMVQRHQSLIIELPADLPRVDGDATRLTQVFVNLLANASKFAPEGSSVRIGAEARDGGVAAWVEDEGPGVADMDSGAIFDRFYRARDAEPEPAGLGLGLWIVRSIIERHGGTVRAERTAAGRTRFGIFLPAALPVPGDDAP